MVSLLQRSNALYVSDVLISLCIVSKTFLLLNQMGYASSLLVHVKIYVMRLSQMSRGPLQSGDCNRPSPTRLWQHLPALAHVAYDAQPSFVRFVRRPRFCPCVAMSIHGCAS